MDIVLRATVMFFILFFLIRLLGKGLLHPELLITDQLPMRDVAHAFQRLDAEDPKMIKMVLDVQAA